MSKITKFGTVQHGARPVFDLEILNEVSSLDYSRVSQMARDEQILKIFSDRYYAWIRSSRNNEIRGLERFDRFLCFAVTHALEQFILKHHGKRFLIFKGEYPGTVSLVTGNSLNYAWLDNTEPMPGDAIILSAPYSGSGNIHPEMTQLLQKARSLNIPVMLDCAFFGICRNLRFDLDQFDVETIAFSLSKAFGLSNHRVGMIFTNSPPIGIKVLNDFGYLNRLGTAIGTHLLNKFSPDFIFDKYSSLQNEICLDLGDLTPSDTVLFGLGGRSWQEFDRSGFNRVSFGDFLAQTYQNKKYVK